MRGVTSPFDGNKQIAAALISCFEANGMNIFRNILRKQLTLENVQHVICLTRNTMIGQWPVNRDAAINLAKIGLMSGVAVSGLVALTVLGDNMIQNMYKAKIEAFTYDIIKQHLSTTYANELKKIMHNFLGGDLEKEIDKLKRTVESMRKKVESFKKEESKLISLSTAISKIRISLKELENTDIIMD
ncbi:hypothetical protein MHBO_004326 [Bonamia ostreae]|uniref:Uncharacterized protein n=1 Tax=Bonamia ostreae TaxID=126728 RepID=A0ABV2AT25_9EUKA